MPISGISLAKQPSDREVVFSRLLDAPRELVWSVWSDVKHIHQWWGPTGFTTTTHEFEFVPDGTWRYIMHGPDGTDYPTRVVFLEIVEPARLVYENSWDLPGAPVDFKVVVSLVAVGKKTDLSLHMTFRDAEGFKRAVERYGILTGGVQTFDRLAQYVAQV
jgi:uncharacterized protein YndB with AHSA1/START domain